MKRYWMPLLIAAIVVALPGAVLAADDAGGDVLLSSRNGSDFSPAVAYNSSANAFLVVWQTADHIRGQRYDAGGVPIGEGFDVGTAILWSAPPAVAYSLAADCYLVVWQQFTENGRDIVGQRVDADGTLQGGALSIRGGKNDQDHPDVASDGTDFYVVWHGADDAHLFAIYGRPVRADGTLLGEQLVAGGDGVNRIGPAIAYNPWAGEYLVAFERSGPTSSAIHARRLNGGGPLGAEYAVSGALWGSSPDLVATPWGATGGYVVVWYDQVDTAWRILGRVVLAGSDSGFDGGQFSVGSTANAQTHPAIARAPATGDFLVTWEDDRQWSVSGTDVYAQHLTDDANLAGTNQAISAAAGDQGTPAIAAGQGPDQYLVAWEDDRLIDYDVYGQRVDLAGTPLWYEFNVSAQPEAQSFPDVAYDPDMNRYLAVWQDQRDGHWAVYGQYLAPDGRPLEAPWAIESDRQDNVEPTLAYSGAGHYFIVAWADTTAGQIEGRPVDVGWAGPLIVVPDSLGGRRPRLAYLPGPARFVLAWDNGDDVFAHALQDDGTPLPGASSVVAGGAGWQGYPALTAAADAHCLVAWQDNLGGVQQVFGRLLNPDASLNGNVLPIAGGGGIPRARPSVAYQDPTGGPGTGRYLVVFQRMAGAENDIYGQRLDEAGAKVGGEIAIRSQPAGADQVAPAVAYAAAPGLYYVVWVEHQAGGDHDLYGQWLAHDLSPASGVLPFFRYAGNQDVPRLAYDWDTQQGLVVWLDSRRSAAGDVYARLGTLDTQPPVARFTSDPTTGQVGDTFVLDARASTDNLTPPGALVVRWDWTSDGTWDTAWSLNKVVSVSPPQGVYTITVAVRDTLWLTGTASLPIAVLPAGVNQPPVADLAVTPLLAAAGTSFQFDASGSTDPETAAASLQARWDWENDGTWDTGWSLQQVDSHVYTVVGLHLARVEVRDPAGLTDAALQGALVLPASPVALEISPPEVTLPPGGAYPFRVTGRDSFGNEMSNLDVTWAVADPRAGTISARGLFTAGLACDPFPDTIVATWSDLRDTAGVSVICPCAIYLPVVLRHS